MTPTTAGCCRSRDYGADPRAARARPSEPPATEAAYRGRRLLRPAPRRCLPPRPLRADRRSRARLARPQRPAVVRARAGQDAPRRRPRLVRLHRGSSRAESLPLDLLSLDGLDRRRRAERPLAVRALPAGRPDARSLHRLGAAGLRGQPLRLPELGRGQPHAASRARRSRAPDRGHDRGRGRQGTRRGPFPSRAGPRL